MGPDLLPSPLAFEGGARPTFNGRYYKELGVEGPGPEFAESLRSCVREALTLLAREPEWSVELEGILCFVLKAEALLLALGELEALGPEVRAADGLLAQRREAAWEAGEPKNVSPAAVIPGEEHEGEIDVEWSIFEARQELLAWACELRRSAPLRPTRPTPPAKLRKGRRRVHLKMGEFRLMADEEKRLYRPWIRSLEWAQRAIKEQVAALIQGWVVQGPRRTTAKGTSPHLLPAKSPVDP